jgi:glycosyltransferase involved in cell wall biosynthesis
MPPTHIAVNGWFFNQLTTGHGQYLQHLLARLPEARSGVKISFLAPLSNPADSVSGSPGIEIVALRLPPLPKNLAKLWWEQVTVPWAARRLHADVLWTPYWSAPLWSPCAVVVTVHDLIPVLLPAYRGGRLQRLYTALVRHTSCRADALLTVSHASARDIIRHLGVPADRVRVVYHGPNQQGVGVVDDELLARVRRKYNLPRRFFLYLGGFDIRKNIRATIAAYCRYLEFGGDPAVRLVIAGRLPAVDSPFAPDPRKIAAELQLNEQVQCCGWVDEEDKAALYHLATAFVFPSLYEGFGMMVLEAMQAGAPVITSAER